MFMKYVLSKRWYVLDEFKWRLELEAEGFYPVEVEEYILRNLRFIIGQKVNRWGRKYVQLKPRCVS